ncbi:MAG TPA: hypothetical protein VG028_01620 [Terriglobia bacterium]|nr:hypothetical protein [Terriglobia bacterium]
MRRCTDKSVPLYFSAPTPACLTRQALPILMRQLLDAPDGTIHRSGCSQARGRMLVEEEAPDQKTLEPAFAERDISWEWVVRLHLDAGNGKAIEH